LTARDQFALQIPRGGQHQLSPGKIENIRARSGLGFSGRL
jgi:hypothetical protein